MNELQEELQKLDNDHMRRRLRTVTQVEAANLFIDGKPFLNFSSNNYLGLARHPQVLEAAKEVIEHWGVGATSSRLISGTSIVHADLESTLAAFMETEAALVFPTGYQANIGIVTTLVGPGDAIIMDRLCHASLVDAARLSGARLFVYGHADVASAEKAMERAASYRRRLFITESLFSMDGDFAPLAELFALAKKHQAITLVDEAHSLGIWERVKGADVVVGTLSKALGSQGGFVAGNRNVIEALVNKARSFIYTTGLSPIAAAAAQAALGLVQEDPKPREKVKRLAGRLLEGLKGHGWNTLNSSSQIIPVLVGPVEETLRLADRLEASGIYAPAIRPPTVHAGECRIRFSVTAEHNDEHINHVVTTLSRLGRGTPKAG